MNLDAADTALCQTTARDLRLQSLPIGLAFLALIWTLIEASGTLASLAWLLLAMQIVWATRLYVDMRVFELFARGILTPEAFDEALHRIHLAGPTASPPRSIANRVAGVRRLVRWQGMLTTLCLSVPLVARFGNLDV